MLVDPANLIKNMSLARREVVTEVHQLVTAAIATLHEHGVAQVVRVCVCVLARTCMRGTLSGHVSVRAIVRPCVRARVRVCAHMRDARKDGRNVDLLLPAVGTASQQAA